MLKDTQLWDPALTGYKDLITKFPAWISKKAYKYFRKIGNVYTTKAHLGEALAMWPLLPISQGNDKNKTK